jgi:biopolymer transport protein ExbD
MTAFLSIQIVLLFLFVVALADRPDLPMNTTDAVAVAHAVPMPSANREDAIIVAIQRDDAVWLGNNRLSSLEQLRTGIRDAVSHGAEHKVYIRADKRAKYGAVLQILSTVRAAGVEDVAFLVDERK